MDYKKVDRIADRIKNPTKKKPEDRMMQVIDKRTGKNIFVKKSEVMKDPKKYFPAKSNYEAALAIAKSREPGSRVSVPDIERAMQSIQGKRKGGLTGGQKKLDKNKNNRIDAQDFKILKAEKAKGRGMGLQDEKVKPGKVMKASKGGESKYEKLKRAFPEKSPEGRAKLDTMLGSKYTPMKKERLFAGSAARRKEGLKKLLKNVRKAIPGVGMLDVKVTKKSKGGGADTGTKGEMRSKLSVAADRFKRRMSQMPGKITDEERKKIKELLKDVKPARPARPMPNIKSDGPKRPMPSRPKPSLGPLARRMGGGMMKKYSKGGGADMGTKMSDKRRKKLKDILSRLKAPRTINIKPEFKSGTSNPMQRDRKREGYRAKVEKAGGKVMFGDERGMKKFKNFMGGGMMNKPMGYKKGASIMARGCKLGRKKATKLY